MFEYAKLEHLLDESIFRNARLFDHPFLESFDKIGSIVTKNSHSLYLKKGDKVYEVAIIGTVREINSDSVGFHIGENETNEG